MILSTSLFGAFPFLPFPLAEDDIEKEENSNDDEPRNQTLRG